MRTLKILIWVLLILGGYLIYGYKNEQSYSGKAENRIQARVDVAPTPEVVDARIEKLEAFFTTYNSPFKNNTESFIKIADKYNLDWKILPAISCVESSCGKNYNLNAFGWGSDTIDCGSDLEDAECVAKGIATLPYYQRYRETGKLDDLAKAYNPKFWKKYLQNLRWFYEKM